MTREEAIKNIKEHCYFANLLPQVKEALDMAIEALEQEPCNTDTCKVVKAYMNEWDKPNNKDIIQLPPVNPQPKTGKWMETDSDDPYWYMCSECHRRLFEQEAYCPSCMES